MKNILIVITSFRHGGINKSLQNLSSIIDTNKFCIDVFAMAHYGPYKTMLPNCNILEKNSWVEALIAQFEDIKGIEKLRSFFIKVTQKLLKYVGFDFTNFIFKYAAKPFSNSEYDVVIAFSEGVPTFFTSHITNPNKIAWVRCDYSSYLKLNHNPSESSIYVTYNSIVCVSEFTRLEFIKHIPSMSEKVNAIHNVLDTTMMLNAAKDIINDTCFKKEKFNIISIGGINVVKRFSRIPQIVRILIDRGCSFRWYLIGPAMQINEQTELEKNIKAFNVSSHFNWLGSKDNPYPYIAQSDLLVNISISEAAPNVINEAKILHTPVVCTDFGSAREFITNKVDGCIVPIEKIADTIELLITDRDLYQSIQNNLNSFQYENKKILEKVLNLL